MLEKTQANFVEALRAPDLPPPPGVAGRSGEVPVKRFAVYRNNVHVSLVEALRATYPVTARLVGEEFFQAMARLYAGRVLPATPVLIDYGESFPDHIDGFAPARSLPYLGDVARLEWAWSRAYHAADARPLALAALAAVPPEASARLVLELHPSIRLVASSWPILKIWRTNRHDAVVAPVDLRSGGEEVLLTRPAWEVELRALEPGQARFVRALLDGATIGGAWERSRAAGDALDLGAALGELFAAGAVTGYSIATAPEGEA